MIKKIIAISLCSVVPYFVHASDGWDETRREEDFKKQDALFKKIQRITGADKYEQEFLDRRDKEKAESEKIAKQERIRRRVEKNKDKEKP